MGDVGGCGDNDAPKLTTSALNPTIGHVGTALTTNRRCHCAVFRPPSAIDDDSMAGSRSVTRPGQETSVGKGSTNRLGKAFWSIKKILITLKSVYRG